MTFGEMKSKVGRCINIAQGCQSEPRVVEIVASLNFKQKYVIAPSKH